MLIPYPSTISTSLFSPEPSKYGISTLIFATNQSCFEATFVRAVRALCFLRPPSSTAHLRLPRSSKFQRVANGIDPDRPKFGTARLTPVAMRSKCQVRPAANPCPETIPINARPSAQAQRTVPPSCGRRIGNEISTAGSEQSANIDMAVSASTRHMRFRAPGTPRLRFDLPSMERVVDRALPAGGHAGRVGKWHEVALLQTLLAQHHRDATLPKQLDSSRRHACDSPFQP